MSAATVCQELEEFVPALEAELLDCEELTLAQRVLLLQAARECQNGMYTFVKQLERAIATELGEGNQTKNVPGVGLVESTWSKPKRWDKNRLVAAVTAVVTDSPEVLFDRETGDMLPPAVIGERVIGAFLTCAGIGYGKLTGLRRFGLDPEKYFDEGEWSPKVSVTR